MTLERLLRLCLAPESALTYESPSAWWRDHVAQTEGLALPIDRAIAGAARVEALGLAFAGGYAAALQSMVPSLRIDTLASFAATEEGGAHPRNIATTLTPAPGGGFLLEGRKSWVTLGPDGGELLVVARLVSPQRGVLAPEDPSGSGHHPRTEGAGADAISDRPILRVARVPASAAGVTLTPHAHAAFVPEVPHASLRLEGVRLAGDAVLAGDGYDAYLKPFRTIEDVHVHAAVWAWLTATGMRHGWPRELALRAVALIVLARALASASPSDPATHVALAGLVEESRALVSALEPSWAQVPEALRARWERDRVILGVAGKARAQRLEKAWSAIGAR